MKNKKTYTKKIFEATYIASNPEEIKKLKASNVLAKDDVVKIDKDANNSSMALSENNKNTEEPIHVEYLSNMKDEEPFEIYGDKYQYVWAKYANGERHPAVYCFKDETTVSYLWFKENIAKHQNLHEDNNEENINYDFDTTNLYKFLKDGLYQLKDIDYAEGAKILEQELLKNFDINKKSIDENNNHKENIKHAEEKQQFLKHVSINSHPSMKGYYQGEYEKQNKHVGDLKNKKIDENLGINRPKDANGNDITLKARVEDINTGTVGHVIRFGIDDNNNQTVHVDWMYSFGDAIPKAITYPNKIIVNDNSRIVREENNDVVDGTNIPKLQQDVKILVDKIETVLKPYLAKINKPVEQAELIAAIAERIGIPREKLSSIIGKLRTIASQTNVQQDVTSTSQVNENRKVIKTIKVKDIKKK